MRIILIIVCLLGFFLVHLIKLMRLYLIVMDQKISFERFVPAYLRTTLVNLIVPFKLGEIYRIGEFWRISKGFKTGFFSVLTDRFFDTLAIILILLPYQIFISRRLTLPVILLSAFIFIVLIAYVIFPSSYRFLNRYIIVSKSSKRSMTVLSGLEVVNDWYEYVRDLITGRYGLLMLLSLLAWAMEIIVIASFSKVFGQSFSVADFGTYIESIISGKSLAVGRAYTISGIVVIFIATIVFTVYYLVNSKRSR